MCEMSEERTYYIRTSLMYTDLTREVLFKVFKYLIKSEDITGFLSSLEQQNILKELFKKNVINRYDYDLVSGQVLNLERLDISLLIRLILNLCKDNIPKPQRGWKTKPQPKDESLCADLLRLRDVRNKIIGHRADAKLSEAEYEKTWVKIKAILLRVVELVDSTSRENCERRINEYRRLNVDTENAEVKRLLDELLKYKEEFDHLQEKVEELSRTSNEFQVYFQITPERFVRYIKLLFDGGRIVLCGILEKKLGDKDLSEFLEKKKETLIRNIEEKFSSCLYPRKSCSDYNNWDVFLLASVLLLTFDDELSQNEIMYIGRIRSARVNYASLALQSLDTDAFLTSWTDLINCLNHLSINIAEDDKQQVEHLIERYKKKGEEGCDVEEYLKRLSESGVEVRTLNDVYNETITELKDILNQLSQNHIKFKEEHVLEFKLLTTCENEEIKKKAEDLLELNLQASIQNLDQPSDIIRGETDKLVASIAAHPDVKPVEVKRKCIILSFKCSTPGGLLHILNTTQGDQFRSTFRNIANELYYIYGYAFLIQGKYTLESVSRLSRMINKSTTNEGSSEYIRIPLKCSSVDGVKSVLSALKREKTTNSLNRIAEQMSAEFNETVSIKLIPEMMEFRNVFEDTDSEGSSSLGRNEHETEEMISSEIANENDNGNQEEQVYFIIDDNLTLAYPDEKDKEVIRGHGDDKKNEVSAAQHSYDEKMKEYATENKESAWNIEPITDTLQTINLGQPCIKDVAVGEKRTENKLANENDNENSEEHFIFGNKLTLAPHGEMDKEVIRGYGDDIKNEVYAAQQSYDEKMKECATENEASAWNIEAITDTLHTINLGRTRVKDVIVGEKRTGSKLGYKNDNGNQEEQTDFITDNKLTLVHPNETHFDLVPRPANDEKNESPAAQKSFDEKMKECEAENERKESNIKTITNAFPSFIDVIADYDKTPTRRHDINQSTSMNKDKDSLKKILPETRAKGKETKYSRLYEFETGCDTFAGGKVDELQKRKPYETKLFFSQYLDKDLVNKATYYLKEGLKDCIIKFSKENFMKLRFKVLIKGDTKDCNKCHLNTLLPVHSSVFGRCPLGQMSCICVLPGNRIRCPLNFCDVMYDEIIKQHRTSSVFWFATSSNDINWHQTHWKITKFFLSTNSSTIRNCGRIEDLECVDFLDIMINNLEFQKEISCQIDPPSDVVSKTRSCLRNTVSTVKEFREVKHYMITILESIINQTPSTHKAVQNLQQLEKRYEEKQMHNKGKLEWSPHKSEFERRYTVKQMYTQHIYTHRGFQNESDKLKESIKMEDISFAGDEGEMEWFPRKSKEVDVREQQYEDTMKKTGTHDNDIDFETEDPILLSKDEFERVLLEAETSCRIMTEQKTVITESNLLILQDKIEYLIQASETAAATSFQRQNLDSVRKSFLNIKKIFLSGAVSRDMEYQAKKQDFRRRMHFGYHRYMDACLNFLDCLYLYSHDGERIRSEKDIFYQRGSLSKNIVVSGSKLSCQTLCVFLAEKCSRHAYWPDFQYVFRLPLRYVNGTHIHDMIKSHFLAGGGDVIFFEQVLFREADKCLIILEELDKWIPYEHDILDMKNRQLSTAQRSYQLPKRNHMTEYVVLVTTNDTNVENINLGETDRLLYLKGSDSDSDSSSDSDSDSSSDSDSDLDSDSDTFNKLVSQGEKNVQLDRDSIPGPSKYCSAVLPTEPSSDSFED
ncbi:uncharacterized protein LOC132759753 isoform X2 [Ruditapes philippinarum]|uniref:uncharacterized protein LOC132759753 isoform X2 n=1 Tax=Ruditapes philippinarum TaxID=129788 RepID=UPI00295B3D9E|nr:uncharacterized protein LOC132759753 isoform X2 [Ruditapes philippinarum]